MEEIKNSIKELSREAGRFIGKVIVWLISTAFILWGWNTLAPHINCPTFGYWEIFAMRMGFSYITDIIGGNLFRKR